MIFNAIDREAKELLPCSIFVVIRRYSSEKRDFWRILTLRYHQNEARELSVHVPTVPQRSDL